MQKNMNKSNDLNNMEFYKKETEYLTSIYWQIVKNSEYNQLTKQKFKEFLGISEFISFKIFEMHAKVKKCNLTLTEFLEAINCCFSIVKVCDKKTFVQTLFNMFRGGDKKLKLSEIRKWLDYLIFDVFIKFKIFDFENLNNFISRINQLVNKIFNLNYNKNKPDEISLLVFEKIMNKSPVFLNFIFFFFNLLCPINVNLINKLTLNNTQIFQNDELTFGNESDEQDDEIESKPLINSIPSFSLKEINLNLLKNNERINKSRFSINATSLTDANSTSSSPVLSTKSTHDISYDSIKNNISSDEEYIHFINRNTEESKLNNNKISDFYNDKFNNIIKNEGKSTKENIPTHKFYILTKKDFLEMFNNNNKLDEQLKYVIENIKNLKKQTKLKYNVKNILFSELQENKFKNEVKQEEQEKYNQTINFFFDEINSCFKSQCSDIDTNNVWQICDITLTEEHLIINKTINETKSKTKEIKASYFFKLKNIFFSENIFSKSSENFEYFNLDGAKKKYYFVVFSHLNQKYKIHFEYLNFVSDFAKHLKNIYKTNFNLPSIKTIEYYHESFFSKLQPNTFHDKNIKDSIFMHSMVLNQPNKTIKFHIFKKEKLNECQIEYFRKIFDLIQINKFLNIPLFPFNNYYENDEYILLQYSDQRRCRMIFERHIGKFSIIFESFDNEMEEDLFNKEIEKFKKLIIYLKEKEFLIDLLDLIEIIKHV